MRTRVFRIGTRGSALAIAQSRQAADALASRGVPVELMIIETEGDRRAPDTPWGEGAFVGTIERALLGGRVDIAVHSAKDMPTDEDARLRIAAYLPRADPRDALVVGAAVAATLDKLPPGTTVGTDSPRRTGFLRAHRPDIEVRPLHGNVDTRLRRLEEGVVDALVLAAAGLDRLGRADRISQRLPAELVPPAPGQGAIALQVRADDAELLALCRDIDDPDTRLAVETEREFLRATGGGCRAPIGALATVDDGLLRLMAGFATLDGRTTVVDEISGRADEAAPLARELATRLVARRAGVDERGRVLVTRPADRLERLIGRLAEHGLGADVVPAIEIRPVADDRSLRAEVARLAEYSWTIVTSANGARAVIDVARRAGVDLRVGRWAVVGRATAEVMRSAGVESMWRPSRAQGASIAEELPIGPRTTVLLLRGSLADDALPGRLRQRGAEIRELVVYETLEAPPSSRALLERALAGRPPAAVLFASPSAVRGLLTLAGDDLRAAVLALPAVCIGATTAAEARAHTFAVVAEAPSQEASVLAETAAQVVAERAAEAVA